MTLEPMTIECFKAYDVRGELDVTLTPDIAYRIARAFAEFLDAKTVVIGCDIRQSSEEIKKASIKGLVDAGTTVIDLGMTGTEEVYFATNHYNADGGIEVTASHNPINYNGMKMVREKSKPISADTGLKQIREIAEKGQFKQVESGIVELKEDKTAYIQHLMTYLDASKIKPLKLVVNPGNGSAGPVVELIEKQFKAAGMPIELIKLHFEPDGTFPNGIPNPMLIENRQSTAEKVVAEQADMGIAWDGDFDRCFFFDEKGRFIDGYYVVGMLAKGFLEKEPGAGIVYDPRVIWNTEDVIAKAGGQPFIYKSGHAFIKDKMREENAAYGGEMSAHHYFRDFFYCDSGMIPWLIVAELVSTTGKSLAKLIDESIEAFPSSGEINTKIADPKKLLTDLEQILRSEAKDIQHIDGLSMSFESVNGEAWRFNLRMSNTEPVVRLNVESRGNVQLMEEKRDYLLSYMANSK